MTEPDICPRCGSDDPNRHLRVTNGWDHVYCEDEWHDRPTDRCPHCRKVAVRIDNGKRCGHCGKDWHDRPTGPPFAEPRFTVQNWKPEAPTGADPCSVCGEVHDPPECRIGVPMNVTAAACPRCGSTNPGIRGRWVTDTNEMFVGDEVWEPCEDEWHDLPTGADPHADDPSCPTCGGTKKLLTGDVYMCTDTWHLYRCHCGKPAVRLIRPTVSLDASPWPGIPVCGDTDR